MDEKREKEAYIKQLNEDIAELEYLVDMPLDDKFKIRIAREKLGMCFPDEIIFYTDME
jgi:cell division protein FtsB